MVTSNTIASFNTRSFCLARVFQITYKVPWLLQCCLPRQWFWKSACIYNNCVLLCAHFVLDVLVCVYCQHMCGAHLLNLSSILYSFCWSLENFQGQRLIKTQSLADVSCSCTATESKCRTEWKGCDSSHSVPEMTLKHVILILHEL